MKKRSESCTKAVIDPIPINAETDITNRVSNNNKLD